MHLVKAAKTGIPIQHVLNDVKEALEKFFTIDREMIRAQMKAGIRAGTNLSPRIRSRPSSATLAGQMATSSFFAAR
jgi:hypothetical protein